MTDSNRLLAEDPGKAPLPGPRGGSDFASPVDLPAVEGEEESALGWASGVIAIAALFLLVFNAGALRDWTYDLEPGPVGQRAVGAAESWFGVTEAVGADRPVAVMHGWWEELKALEFGGDAPSQSPEPQP